MQTSFEITTYWCRKFWRHCLQTSISWGTNLNWLVTFYFRSNLWYRYKSLEVYVSYDTNRETTRYFLSESNGTMTVGTNSCWNHRIDWTVDNIVGIVRWNVVSRCYTRSNVSRCETRSNVNFCDSTQPCDMNLIYTNSRRCRIILWSCDLVSRLTVLIASVRFIFVQVCVIIIIIYPKVKGLLSKCTFLSTFYSTINIKYMT